MQEHHRLAMDKAIARLTEDHEVLAILLGGSIAKGIERFDSDVDLLVIVSDSSYHHRLAANQVAFLYRDVADYPAGYVEGRFLSRSFILEAALRGSEPTRHSFTGVTPVWGRDEEILLALPQIPVYPESCREFRIDAFYSQMVLNQRYFWPEANRRLDPYLRIRSASEIVLFGCRAVLAWHRLLFPNQKRLIEMTERADPAIAELARAFASRMDETSLEEFCRSVGEVIGPRNVDVNSRFTQDSEMSWFAQVHSIAEW